MRSGRNMACDVLWTERAKQDVDDIIGYIAVRLASPQAARDHMAAFEDAVDRISRNPELYAISPQPSCAARGLRACFVKRCVMLYTYHGEGAVLVYRVFSTLRDYASLIEAGDDAEGR